MKKIKEIKNVKSFGLYKHDLFVVNTKNKAEKYNYNLIKAELAFSTLYSIDIKNQYLVDYGLKILDLNHNTSVIDSNEGYSPLKLIDDDNLICKKVNNQTETVEYFIFNMTSSNFSPIKGFIGNPVSVINDKIVSRKNKIFVFSLKTLKLLWETDIGEYGKHEGWNNVEKSKVNAIFVDKTSIYVLTGLRVLALSLKDGSILWNAQMQTYQSFGILIDGFLYTSSNAFINKIETKTGKILYEEEIKPVYTNGEQNLMPISKFIWHKEFIWTVMDTSPNILLKIDVQDGSSNEVIYLEELGVTKDCEPPKFYKNRMYILDYERTLHVFEDIENEKIPR